MTGSVQSRRARHVILPPIVLIHSSAAFPFSFLLSPLSPFLSPSRRGERAQQASLLSSIRFLLPLLPGSPPSPPCAPLFMREEGPWGPPPPAPPPPSVRLSLSLVVLLLLLLLPGRAASFSTSCWCQGREGVAEVARMGLAGDGSADTAHLRFSSLLPSPSSFTSRFPFRPHPSG